MRKVRMDGFFEYNEEYKTDVKRGLVRTPLNL